MTTSSLIVALLVLAGILLFKRWVNRKPELTLMRGVVTRISPRRVRFELTKVKKMTSPEDFLKVGDEVFVTGRFQYERREDDFTFAVVEIIPVRKCKDEHEREHTLGFWSLADESS